MHLTVAQVPAHPVAIAYTPHVQSTCMWVALTMVLALMVWSTSTWTERRWTMTMQT